MWEGLFVGSVRVIGGGVRVINGDVRILFDNNTKTETKEKEKSGGEGYRSPYLSHAKRALYHLSYTPFHSPSKPALHQANTSIQAIQFMISIRGSLRRFGFIPSEGESRRCNIFLPIIPQLRTSQ